MSCEMVREFLLQEDWDAARRSQAIVFLRHLEHCAACEAVMRDFDEIRLVMEPARPSEPTGGWEAMQRRLVSPIPLGRPHWLGPVLAMAASVLLAFAAFEVGRNHSVRSDKTVATNKINPVEPATFISPREVSHEVQAFRAVSEVYDGHAGWMMVSKNSSDVGMLAEPASSNSRMLILRLGLWQGDESISNADLVVLAGQRADLTLPLPSGRSLHYCIGTSTDEPTQLTLSLEMKAPGGDTPLAALATTVRIQAGQKLSAGKLSTTAGEYELKIDFAGGEVAKQ
jgi:hypothetical protein